MSAEKTNSLKSLENKIIKLFRKKTKIANTLKAFTRKNKGIIFTVKITKACQKPVPNSRQIKQQLHKQLEKI